jgi:prepilin-type N-terminal cleavage/methylation domain-containing protein
MNTKNIRSQFGYTLVELSIGLTVVALVLAGILSGVSSINDSVNFNRSVQQLSDVIGKINKAAKRDTDTSGVTMFNYTRPNYNLFEDFRNLGGENVASGAAPGIATASGHNVFVTNNQTWWTGTNGPKNWKLFIETSGSACGDYASMLQDYAESIEIRNFYGSSPLEYTVKARGATFNSSTVRSACNSPSTQYLILQFNTY